MKFPAAIGRLRIMPQRRNEVLVEWMDKSCKGETNRVNVKHILADAEDITVGAILTARMNSRRYKALVRDLLEWSAPTKSTKKAGLEKSTKKAEKSTKKAAPAENTKIAPEKRMKKAAPEKSMKKNTKDKVRISAALKKATFYARV